MQRVLVLDTNKQPLMPTHPAKARKLLKEGKAAVYRRYPFTIILKYAVDEPQRQPTRLKFDPGSGTTGIGIIVQFARGWVTVWAANLIHRGETVKSDLKRRRERRHNRRVRKTRYRKPKFKYARLKNKDSKKKGWLPPSIMSRVDNIVTWGRRLLRLVPITDIDIETVRFDMQKLENPEISGIEYQQGELFGYELREYILLKFDHKCVYCGAKGVGPASVPLEIEHIIPKSRGGSNRVSNITLSCRKCNLAKGAQTAAEFGHPEVQAQAKRPLKDAAAVNSSRKRVLAKLSTLNLPVAVWSGGRTKHNRIKQGFPKDHWLDAVCVGESGEKVIVPPDLKPLTIKAMGRGNRQRVFMDSHGFPRLNKRGEQAVKMTHKRVHGFQTGDMARVVVPSGKKAGTYVGRVVVKASGSFKVGKVDGVNWKHFILLQRTDGYGYET